jgi:GxxExxY protein
VNDKPQINLYLENQVGDQIVDAAILFHRTLGPGLLESTYQAALSYKLVQNGDKKVIEPQRRRIRIKAKTCAIIASVEELSHRYMILEYCG